MSNRTLFFLVALVLLGMGTIFVLNLLPVMSGSSAAERYIRLNDIEGMAVVYKGKEYTLNFKQQNEAASLFNLSIPIKADISKDSLTKAPFEKIIIYVFKSQKIELTPIGFDKDNLIYSAPAWNTDGYMKDVSRGTLKNLLSTTYDL